MARREGEHVEGGGAAVPLAAGPGGGPASGAGRPGRWRSRGGGGGRAAVRRMGSEGAGAARSAVGRALAWGFPHPTCLSCAVGFPCKNRAWKQQAVK